MISIMLFPILLWSFKLIPHLLVRFWRLWLFDYPLSFTLEFPTKNFLDWHEKRGVTSISVLRTYFQYFNSIQYGNPELLAFQCKYRICSLMGERGKGLRMNSIAQINFWETFELPFSFIHVYKPQILIPWSSFVPFSFREWERNLGGRAQSHFFQ